MLKKTEEEGAIGGGNQGRDLERKSKDQSVVGQGSIEERIRERGGGSQGRGGRGAGAGTAEMKK